VSFSFAEKTEVPKNNLNPFYCILFYFFSIGVRVMSSIEITMTIGDLDLTQ